LAQRHPRWVQRQPRWTPRPHKTSIYRRERVNLPFFHDNGNNRISQDSLKIITEINELVTDVNLKPLPVLLDEMKKMKSRVMGFEKDMKDLIRSHNKPSQQLEETLRTFFLYPEDSFLPSFKTDMENA
jgi:hypothetical protein